MTIENIMSSRNRRKPNKVDVYLTDSDKQLLDELCSEKGLSKTEYFRQLLLQDGEQFRTRRAKNEVRSFSTVA